MNRLRQLREERHITQEELAFELNTSQQRISKIERQLVPMGEEMIRNCARYFGVTADYLLGISDIQVQIGIEFSNIKGLLDGPMQDILFYYKSYDETQRNLIKEIAKVISCHYHDSDAK